LIKIMRILAIETSCDETSIAVLEANKDGPFTLLSNIILSQIKIHAPFGGVVPTLAKREHQKNLVPILKQSLNEAKLLKSQKSKVKSQSVNWRTKSKILEEILSREPELLKKLMPFLTKYGRPDIDLIAVTNGPGLEPALWVGVNFAKALASVWDLPIMPVNHVEAHIIANWLPYSVIPAKAGIQKAWMPDQVRHDKKDTIKFPNLLISQFPAISLVVSGGHTQLVLMHGFGKYEILGETRDDAAGEAFDKLARMLNLGYPGGPIVAKIAAEAKKQDLKNVRLPRPMISSKDYDFSFSGLKTAALYFVKTLDKKTLKKLAPAICLEFQQAAIDVLISKTIRAAKEFSAKTVLLSGGVAANDLLRGTLKLETCNLKLNFSVPPKEFCTDNAAMIALTALCATKHKKPVSWEELTVEANLRIA